MKSENTQGEPMKHLITILSINLLLATLSLADGVDTELQRLALKFLAHKSRSGELANLSGTAKLRLELNKLTLTIGRIPDGQIIGSCEQTDGNLRVVIDREHWDASDEVGKEMIAYHELAHCLLKRAHDDSRTVGLDGQSIPKSLMNSHMFPRDIYLAHRDYYLSELFQ